MASFIADKKLIELDITDVNELNIYNKIIIFDSQKWNFYALMRPSKEFKYHLFGYSNSTKTISTLHKENVSLNTFKKVNNYIFYRESNKNKVFNYII